MMYVVEMASQHMTEGSLTCFSFISANWVTIRCAKIKPSACFPTKINF
jgi:hypothetical protein